MNDDTLLKEIIEGDLHTLWNILQLHKDEAPETYKNVKYGIKLHFHIGHELNGQILDRSRAGEVVIANHIYDQEDYWDEKEAREAEARKKLLEIYEEEDNTFTGR